MEDVERESQLTSYFLSLPDEVLANEVFPRLPIDLLNKLCLIHSKFNNICNDDGMWKLKTFNDYPDYYGSKPETLTWRNYYRALTGEYLLPIYYNGDIISYVKFNSNYMNLLLERLISYLNNFVSKSHQINIALIDNGTRSPLSKRIYNPIVVIKYPSLTIDVNSTNYDDIKKILIFINDNFPVTPEKSRKWERVNSEIIYEELTSQFGNPPIYGSVDDDYFRIIDKRNVKDLRVIIYGKVCSTYPRTELLNILNVFGISNLDPNIPRSDLCQLIYNSLKQIGHIINE